MTREEIIRMAQQCGFGGQARITNLKRLEQFAALVAAAERERIKQANAPEIEKINAHIKSLEDAVVLEREACAKVCDEKAKHFRMNSYHKLREEVSEECADAIRARGEK